MEILSGTKDEVMGEMRHIVKGSSFDAYLFHSISMFCPIDLMTENHTLRGLLRNLAAFVGDGAGGILPKMGWELQDFNNFINKGETDTAWEGYHRRKKGSHTQGRKEDADAHPDDRFTAQGAQKRPADLEVNGNATKRQRSGDKDYDNMSNFPMMMSMPVSSIPASQAFPAVAPPRPQMEEGLFLDLLSGSSNGPSYFIPPSSRTNTQYPSPDSNMDGYPRSFVPTVNIGMEQQSSAAFHEPPTPSTSVTQARLQQSGENRDDEELEDESDPKKTEAFRLIQSVFLDIFSESHFD